MPTPPTLAQRALGSAAKKRPRELTPQMVKFCNEMLACIPQYQAAVNAGYSPHSAKDAAYHLMRDPRVKAYIAERQAAVAEKAEYELEDAVKELNEKIAGATAKGAWSAVMSGMEMKNKLFGRLKNQVEIESGFIDITAALNAANARLSNPRSIRYLEDGSVIDVSATEVPGDANESAYQIGRRAQWRNK